MPAECLIGLNFPHLLQFLLRDLKPLILVPDVAWHHYIYHHLCIPLYITPTCSIIYSTIRKSMETAAVGLFRQSLIYNWSLSNHLKFDGPTLGLLMTRIQSSDSQGSSSPPLHSHMTKLLVLGYRATFMAICTLLQLRDHILQLLGFGKTAPIANCWFTSQLWCSLMSATQGRLYNT